MRTKEKNRRREREVAKGEDKLIAFAGIVCP